MFMYTGCGKAIDLLELAWEQCDISLEYALWYKTDRKESLECLNQAIDVPSMVIIT